MTVAPLVLEALALSVQASSGYGLDGGGAAVPTATYRGSIDGAAEVLVSAMNLKLYNSPYY